MECIYFPFNYQKATQTINYFARKNNNTIDKLRVIKLIFFADRYHLRKYGRLVTNDSYFAMKLGPVNSGTKDIIDKSYFIDSDIINYSEIYLSKDKDNINNIDSINDVDFNVFSKSDIEALDFAWQEFGKYDPLYLKDLTHNYPEWKKHESAIDNGVKSIPIDLKDFFDDPEPQYNPCYSLTETEKEYNLAFLIEQSQVKDSWN